jgi:pimeloyl-ACP methyl ester carboxylesterase
MNEGNEPQYQVHEIGGLQSHSCILGHGDPVLLLHGWGGSIQSMLPVAKKLAEAGFKSYLIDLPGFGKTQLPPQAWGVPDYTQWVIAYLNAMNLDKVFIIGHSFGGRISFILGADHPERIYKNALCSPAGVKLPPTMSQKTLKLGRNTLMTVLSLPVLNRYKGRVRENLRQRFSSEDYLNAGPLQETFLQVVRQDLLPYARRVKAPTLLFWGSLDTETPLKMGQILEKEMPDAALIVLDGVGHFGYLDQLPQFVRVVTHFFREKSKTGVS